MLETQRQLPFIEQLFGGAEQMKVKKVRRKYLYMVMVDLEEGVKMACLDGASEYITPCPRCFFMSKGDAQKVAYRINKENGGKLIAQLLKYEEDYVKSKLVQEGHDNV